MKSKNAIAVAAGLLVLFSLTGMPTAQGAPNNAIKAPPPITTRALAFDVSPPLRSLPVISKSQTSPLLVWDVRPERGPDVPSYGFAGDAAVQRSAQPLSAKIDDPLLTFEGLRNTDNPFLVAPPDPIGAVGPNHYVEMVNLVFAVYDKQGNRLSGPTNIGDLWLGFSVTDCNDFSGDPVVLYDRRADRWLLTQFTTKGPIYYNCVAISQTSDPTGSYFRYAFSAGPFFPDYPKYGVWKKSYLLTSRDFGNDGSYGISVYGLERRKMIEGDPNARMVHFFLDSAVVPIYLIGDGLLPADIDGRRLPEDEAPAPVVGTMDNNGPYGAPFDGLNIWELSVEWEDNPEASLVLAAQLPVAPFDSTFPCAPTSRSCIPQPGTARKVDILSYRQRPTWRLAYRNFDDYEAMVTNQSVQALPGVAGVRWYEIRRHDGEYRIRQQGTYAPDDGVHRWMGSIAMDMRGDMAVGYSVSNGTSVFPGIRYTGRRRHDPLGQMTLGEATIIDGSGSQLTRSGRWGDYTSMNVDPLDDCTFWYVNEYYQVTSLANWQTRIGSFKLPHCGEREH